MKKIAPCLWFDSNAEKAVKFYLGVFKKSKITRVARYSKVGHDQHGRPAGSVMTIAFELNGQPFTALNGGPVFKFSEAISFQIDCATQAEVDYYWKKLSAGGDKQAQVCGWVKDRFGVSWQIVPRVLPRMLADRNRAKADRAMAAMLEMKKLDIAKLQRAFAGEDVSTPPPLFFKAVSRHPETGQQAAACVVGLPLVGRPSRLARAKIIRWATLPARRPGDERRPYTKPAERPDFTAPGASRAGASRETTPGPAA